MGYIFLRNGTKNFININTNSTPHKLISNRVVSFSEDTKGIIWIGTFEGGLYSFDINTDKLIHYDDQQFIGFELEKRI